MKRYLIITLTFILINIGLNVSAKEIPFTIEDRDRIIRIETRLFEIDKRFEQIDKRFEQIDKRFEQIDKRFDQMMNFLWMLTVIFVGVTGVTISFALWDRRTMIRPFEAKVKTIDEAISQDKEKINLILETLRNLAKTDEKLAEILKSLNLL